MDNVPPEIHMKIYRYACTDDGSTGSSLSSVSKRVREISAEYRYQSIAVCGPAALTGILQALRDVPERLRRIQYLFIYDYSSLSPRRPEIEMSMFQMRWLRVFDENMLKEMVGKNIVELLSLAQPTVEVLSLVSFAAHVEKGSVIPLLQGTFPHLYDLTVRGPHELPLNPSFAPVLRRLHLSNVW
ncbi:hypothetical protein C8J57DRAFT_1611893, partial [Mycena rebaudengoi]